MALRLFLQSLTRERHHARHFQDDYTIDEEPIQARPHRRLTKELHPLAPAHFAELNRLHFQYYLIRMVIKHHYLAPIDQPKGILDVGCGHGPWAQEVARTFPAAKVFGVDILPPPVVKTALFPPKNYRFLIKHSTLCINNSSCSPYRLISGHTSFRNYSG